MKHIADELLKHTLSNNEIYINRDDVIVLLNEIRFVLFPGYFQTYNEQLDSYIINKLNNIYNYLNCLLLKQKNVNHKDITNGFIKNIISIKMQLNGDLSAFLLSDPAITNKDEVIICYPGFYAISLYRIANALAKYDVNIIPRIITEHAHSKTGIDIHPKALIGKNFFIDHGTGVVIGETSVIKDNVKIYQGVTLGAISLNNIDLIKNKKRHPTIENNVTIYSNTSILGANTVIGENCVIGSNLFITKSVEKNSKIVFNSN